MGEFTGSNSNLTNAIQDVNIATGRNDGERSPFATDVEGIEADDVVKKGIEEFPVFNVDTQEFFSNQKSDRKRIRFKVGSKAGQYMQKTKNGLRPFYIRTTDSSGVSYTRKVR